MKVPVPLPLGRPIISPLEMEGKSVVQFLFWNRFHSIKIAETKLEHKEEAILNFYKEFFLDILQFILPQLSHYCKVSSKRDLKKTLTPEKTMLLKLGTGNGERGTGNECTAVIRLRIQNGGGNDVYKP